MDILKEIIWNIMHCFDLTLGQLITISMMILGFSLMFTGASMTTYGRPWDGYTQEYYNKENLASIFTILGILLAFGGGLMLMLLFSIH